MLAKRFFAAFACFCSTAASAQQTAPEIAVQTGFIQEALTNVEFSNDNRYLYAYNELNEHIIWDLATSRQIKRVSAPLNAVPALLYLPKASFSDDGNLLLIPDFPSGEYSLFSLRENRELYRFIPPQAGLHYTHALFSGKSDQVLLLLQSDGKAREYYFETRRLSGELIYRMHASFEHPFDKISEGTKLLLGSQIRTAGKTALIKLVTTDPALKQLVVVTSDDRVYHFNMSPSSTSNLTVGNNFQVTLGYRFSNIKSVRFAGNDLAMLLEGNLKKSKDNTITTFDTLLYVSAAGHNNARKKTSRVISRPVEKRSNSLQVQALTSDIGLSTYFEDQLNGNELQVVAKDFNTDQVLFSYKNKFTPWLGKKTMYQPGQLNGGKLAAISGDRTKMAECSWEMLVYDLGNAQITNQFSPSRGTVKLFRPLFIDSATVYIPRLSENGFLFNIREGNVYNVGIPLTCDDTLNNGAASFFQYERVSELDLHTATYDAERNSIFQVSYRPLGICHTGYKIMTEIPLNRGALPVTVPVRQYEETFSTVKLPHSNRLLVNGSLLQPVNGELVPLQLLAIKEKKDSFFTMKPQLLDTAGTIFSILHTRTQKGSPDLLFATWNASGQLLEKTRIKRKDTGYPFQSYVFESTLSPDKKHLLFMLYDGTIGIYSLEKKAIVQESQAGDEFKLKVNGLFRNWINFSARLGAVSGCFVSNSRYVTAGVDSRLLEWDINNAAPVRQINQNDRHLLLTIDRSPDGKYLYGVDIDKTIKFIDYASGELAFRFLAPDHQSYLVINRDGYYMTNKNSVNNLAYLYHGTTYNFSQFDAILNRPDKLLRSIGYTGAEKLRVLENAKEMQLRRMGITSARNGWSNDLSAPELTVSEASRSTTTTADQLNLTIAGIDRKVALKALHVSVNGIPVYGKKGKPISATKTADGFVARLQLGIPLADGANEISLWLTNANGVESLQSFRRVDRTASAGRPDLYVISIGAGKYKEAGMNLQFAEKDAHDVQSLFSGKTPGYGKVIPISLYNEQVLREKLPDLKKQLQKSKINDRVIIYYAGHGLISKDYDYYLGTYDIDFANPEKRGISYNDLENLVDSIPARYRLLLLDACHSGDFDKEEQKTESRERTVKGNVVLGLVAPVKNKAAAASQVPLFDIMRQRFVDIENGAGATVIASSSSREYSWETGDLKNGLFTHCLLEGCRSGAADLDKNGDISLSELNQFLSNTVSSLSEGRQKPTSRVENTLLDFVVYPLR